MYTLPSATRIQVIINTALRETKLIGFTQEIADSLDQGQQTDVIVIDFSKAFDKVDHHKLVHKLKHMWVNLFITT